MNTALSLYPQPLIVIFLFILGACIGSFLNVVIIRLPQRLFAMQDEAVKEYLNEKKEQRAENLEPEILPSQDSENNSGKSIPDFFAKRSQCLFCQHTIRWNDNIPMISFLLLQGRCRDCNNTIGLRYFWVELITALAFALIGVVYYTQDVVMLIGMLVFASCLLALAFIDAEYQILPDEITLPMIWLGLLFNLYDIYTPLNFAVVGAVAGYLCLWILYQLHYVLTKREGLGYGDFKLLAMIGAWLGVFSLAHVLLIASITALVFFLAQRLILAKQTSADLLQEKLAFGPFLAMGAGVYIFILPRLIYI